MHMLTCFHGFWGLMQGYISTRQEVSCLSPEHAQWWVQSWLALTPFAFTETRYFVDWVLAWSLIGEWTIYTTFSLHQRVISGRGTGAPMVFSRATKIGVRHWSRGHVRALSKGPSVAPCSPWSCRSESLTRRQNVPGDSNRYLSWRNQDGPSFWRLFWAFLSIPHCGHRMA